MKTVFLFFTQVFAQKSECLFCSATYIDGIGVIDGDTSCFEGSYKKTSFVSLLNLEKIKGLGKATKLGEKYVDLKFQNIHGTTN